GSGRPSSDELGEALRRARRVAEEQRRLGELELEQRRLVSGEQVDARVEQPPEALGHPRHDPLAGIAVGVRRLAQRDLLGDEQPAGVAWRDALAEQRALADRVGERAAEVDQSGLTG